MQNENTSEIDRLNKLFQQNDLNSAMELANKIIAGNPECYDALFVRGKIHSRLGEMREAIGDYAKAKEINPAGAAGAAYDAAIEVMNFFNHDLYNP